MGGSPRVLIVEPNPFMAEMQRAILRCFDVTFVRPECALEAVTAQVPALVITEILLQGRDGLELCRELRRRPATQTLPIIVFSVLDARAEAKEAGADSFLLKPAERGALGGEVRRLTLRRPAGPDIPAATPGGDS